MGAILAKVEHFDHGKKIQQKTAQDVTIFSSFCPSKSLFSGTLDRGYIILEIISGLIQL